MEKTKKIVVKRVGEPPEVLEVDFKYRCELKNIIDTDIVEKFPFCNGIFLSVDEEGILKEKPHNFYISVLNAYKPIQIIVGTAVFCKYKQLEPFEENYDYELITLKESDIKFIKFIFNENYQAELKKNFYRFYGSMEQYLKPVVINLDDYLKGEKRFHE